MLGKIVITDLSGKEKEISIYDLLEIKEEKDGGMLWTFGGDVEGEGPKECRKVVYKEFKGEKKNCKYK